MGCMIEENQLNALFIIINPVVIPPSYACDCDSNVTVKLVYHTYNAI